MGVFVGGIDVFVGGTGVLVRVGGGVRVGGLEVRVAAGADVIVKRGRLVCVGVMVTKRLCVSVGCAVMDAGTFVAVGARVSVGTKTVTTCSVSAAAVPKLETARSTMLIGSSVMGM